jgi:hypothetical protein
MPPSNVAAFLTTMALLPAETLPLLAIEIPLDTTPPLTRMPALLATILPLSTMAPWMVLPLRTAMPVGAPEMRLLLRKPPSGTCC